MAAELRFDSVSPSPDTIKEECPKLITRTEPKPTLKQLKTWTEQKSLGKFCKQVYKSRLDKSIDDTPTLIGRFLTKL